MSVRPSVDLPQPDSPTSPSVSPRLICRSTPSTACTLPDGALQEPRCGPGSTSAARAPRAGRRVARAAVRAAVARPVTASGAVAVRRPRSQSQQADSCSSTVKSGGCSSQLLERVVAARAAKRQPGGQSSGLGTVPRITRSGSDCVIPSSGIDCSSASVYGCCGEPKTSCDRAALDDPAGVHDDDVVAHLGDDAEVVRDEQDRHAEPLAAAPPSARGSAPGSSRRAPSSARRR